MTGNHPSESVKLDYSRYNQPELGGKLVLITNSKSYEFLIGTKIGDLELEGS